MFVFEWNRIGPNKDHLIIRDEQGKIVFEDDKCSSYPDYPQGIGILNDGMPDPTLHNGQYLMQAVDMNNLYGATWRCLQPLNLDGTSALPVVRMTGESTSQGIKHHFRLDDELHLTYVASAGCLTQLKERFLKMREVVGLTQEAVKNGEMIGVLIIKGEPTFPQPYEGGL